MNSDYSDIPASRRTQNLVLITDDDRSLQVLLKVAMEQEGFEVAQSNSGEQCLRDYQRLKPDMVLLDAVMPGIDGFECCRQIRQLPGADQVPILMITVLDDSESVAQAFEVGATDYITKPIYWAVLSQRVRRLLESHQTTIQARKVAQRLDRYQHWCHVQQQLLTAVQTLPLDQFLQKVLHVLQADFARDRISDPVVLYQVGSDCWLTPEVSPENLPTNLKFAPLSDDDRAWLQSQIKPITIYNPNHKIEAIETIDRSIDSVPIATAFENSLQDLWLVMSVPKIEVFPIFNGVDLQALLIRGKEQSPYSEIDSELEIVRMNSISEMISIAFQMHNRALTAS